MKNDSPARTNPKEQKAQVVASASPGAGAAYPTKTPVKGFYTTSLGHHPQGDERTAKRIYNPIAKPLCGISIILTSYPFTHPSIYSSITSLRLA